MRGMTTLMFLLTAALLEAGGDALVRSGIHATASSTRLLSYAAGAAALLAYAFLVNASSWDFGRAIGVYIACFFLVAQVISSHVFHQPPDRAVMVGGVFIVLGGLVMSFGLP